MGTYHDGGGGAVTCIHFHVFFHFNYVRMLMKYLIKCPESIVELAYRSPIVCKCVYRSLEPLEQMVVMRLLFLNNFCDQTTFSAWFLRPSDVYGVLKSLTNCRVVLKSNRKLPNSPPDKNIIYRLNTTFQSSLIKSLQQTSFAWQRYDGAFELSLSSDDIEKTYYKRWESILNYVVGAQNAPDLSTRSRVAASYRVSGMMMALCKQIGVLSLKHPVKTPVPVSTSATADDIIDIDGDDDDAAPPSQAASKGFQFVLMDPHSQLWEFLGGILDSLSSKQDEYLAFIELLCTLAMSLPHVLYLRSSLPNNVMKYVDYLQELGMMQCYNSSSCAPGDGTTSDVFTITMIGAYHQSPPSHSTRIENIFTHDHTGVAAQFIIVEPNFKVHAYTDSYLYVVILSKFVQIEYRLPNMVAGTLTRDSTRMAYQHGITCM